MENAPAATQAQAAPAATPPTPASAPNVSEVLDKITTARMEGATQAQLDELTSQLLPSSAPVEPAPAVVETKEEPTPAPVEPAPAEPEAAPGTEAAPTPEPPAAEVPPMDPEDDVPGKKGYRPRLDSLPDTQKEAIALVKELRTQGKEITLAEAEKRVNAKYGITDSPEPPAPAGLTITDMEAELATVREQIRAGKTGGALSTPEMDALEDRRIDLITDIKAAKLAGDWQQAEQNRQQQSVQAQRQQYLAQAVDRYPAMKDPNSVQWMVARSIAEAASKAAPGTKEYEDAHAIDAPMRFAEQAAQRIGAKPTGSATPVPPSTPSIAAPVTPKPVAPAPGSKTAAPPTPTKTREQIIAESEERVLAATEGRTPLTAPPGRGTIYVRR